MKNILKIVNYFLFIISISVWFYLSYRIVNYSENHVGWNILWSLYLFVTFSVSSIAREYLFKEKINRVFIIFSIISIILVFGLYFFNILLPYEVWLQRGMPSRPF